MVQFLSRKTYYAGEVIFHEGTVGYCAYLIERGSVRISKKTKDGDVELGILSGGAIFGEMALIDDSPRMATASAAAETIVAVVNHTVLEKKLDEADPFIRALLHILVRYARGMGDKVKNLSEKRS